MMTRSQISAFLILSVACWAAHLWWQGIPLTWAMMAPFSGVVGAVSVFMFLFEAWLWRLLVFRGWLLKRPLLHGTWRVVLQSDWVNPDTAERIPPIHCYMVIRQTASKLSLDLVTQESHSTTVSAGIEDCRNGTFRVSCTYNNQPRNLYRHRSEVHFGAMLLDVETVTPTALEGEYWTDRKTTGSLDLSERNSKVCMTYKQAEALFSA